MDPLTGQIASAAGARRPRPTLFRSWAPSQRWPWALPLIVAAAVFGLSAHSLQTGIGGLVALGLVVLVARAPAKGVIGLVALLPFEIVVLALLYRLGMPASVVRALGGWKEAVVAGLVLAGIHGIRASGRRLDALDGLALAYIAVATVYLAVPSLFIHFSSGGVTAPPPSSVRLLAWRTDCMFAFALLGARHADIGALSRRGYQAAALAAGAVVGGVGVYELLDSSGWNHFAVNVARVNFYKAAVLHVYASNPYDVRYHGMLGGHDFTRAGSVLFSPLTLGFYLVLILGIAIHRAARGRGRPFVYLVISLTAVALLATITRSAILSGALVVLLALRPQRYVVRYWQQRGRRVRFALVVFVGALLIAPVVVATGVSHRTSATASGGQDTTDHVSATTAGFNSLLSHPLGLGIGTAPGVGDRFAVSGKLTSENSYLQVGDELGIPEMVIFVALLVVLVIRLGRAEPDDDDDAPVAGGLRLAVMALIVGGFFLHIWLDFTLALSLWAGAGLAIGIHDRLQEQRRRPLGAAGTSRGRALTPASAPK